VKRGGATFVELEGRLEGDALFGGCGLGVVGLGTVEGGDRSGGA
jgi:hypothetical protein